MSADRTAKGACVNCGHLNAVHGFGKQGILYCPLCKKVCFCCDLHAMAPEEGHHEGCPENPGLKPPAPAPERLVSELALHLRRQRAFSEKTFGPGERTAGVLDHIRKELAEIEREPGDVTEWIDVVILAFDGAWRAGHSPDEIATALVAKQAKNEARTWPDWRTAEPGKAIEHVRESDPAPAPERCACGHRYRDHHLFEDATPCGVDNCKSECSNFREPVAECDHFVPAPPASDALPPVEPFVVKHYTSDEYPSIKGNGFDGLRVGDDRQEAEEFVAWVNRRLAAPALPETVVAVLATGDLFAALTRWDNAGRPGLAPKGDARG